MCLEAARHKSTYVSSRAGLANLDISLVDFLPDSGEDYRRESGATMTKRTRRNHGAVLQGEGGLVGAEGREDAGRVGSAVRCPSEPDHAWKGQLLEGAAGVFGQEKGEAGAPGGGLEGSARQDRRVDGGERFFRRRAHQSRHAERKAMIDRTHDLSISGQAKA